MSASTEDRKKLRCIIIGAGNRGFRYSQYALDFPERLQVVAVADPNEKALRRMKEAHNIPDDNIHRDWKEIATKDKYADFVVVATPDRHHKDPTVSFAKKGYHILLEKPMAISEEDCKEIAHVCKQHKVMLGVCHVLRYFPPMRKIKEIIMSGRIGDVVNIQHLEPVGFWHFGHSYVRGNWRNEAESTFSLLAKCCHDVDLIMWWMGNKRCEKISSFGSLVHFTKENKPAGAGSRCLECNVEQTCPYSAKKLYLGQFNSGNKGWPISVICNAEEPTLERVTNALKTGPYGKCAYECDNDVCDNQVVNMSFSGGATANLTMIAYTQRTCQRVVKIFGTKGEIRFDNQALQVYDFLSGKQETITLPSAPQEKSSLQGHDGADYFTFHSFVKAVQTNDPSLILSGPDDSLASHLLVFAAEKSRRQNRIVDTLTELPSW
ncbi:uncharacterized oxidoreductase SP_1686-like [Apostichopus japonicus]|uniref:uncharacterized oxidoreductase SP_1686-like n=1 Tax=Stichopus japonicus TaxID=307972 RepID=UPI003AB6EB33